MSLFIQLLPYSVFLLQVKTFANFAFLWRFAKVLFAKINLELVPDTTTSWDVPRNSCTCKSSLSLTMALFTYFQGTDSQIWVVHYRRLYLFQQSGLPTRVLDLSITADP